MRNDWVLFCKTACALTRLSILQGHPPYEGYESGFPMFSAVSSCVGFFDWMCGVRCVPSASRVVQPAANPSELRRALGCSGWTASSAIWCVTLWRQPHGTWQRGARPGNASCAKCAPAARGSSTRCGWAATSMAQTLPVRRRRRLRQADCWLPSREVTKHATIR